MPSLTRTATYKLNSGKGFKPQPPVYAVLTDLRMFYFFRFDGSNFTQAKPYFVSDFTRTSFLIKMLIGVVVLPSR